MSASDPTPALPHDLPKPSDEAPHVLMLGPYPNWDMLPMEASYHLYKLWEQDGKDALARNHHCVRAIATRGELGADKALIEALPNLEIIACYGVGTDAIDLPTAHRRGIRVTNTPDVLTGDVADIAVGLALATTRRIAEGDVHVRSGAWALGNMGLATRFHGKRVGIVGLGRIGSTVARRISGFEVEVGYFDIEARPDAPHRFFPDILALAAWSDILIVTLAGGASTHKMIGADAFQALGPTGFLVNVSRGSTVDEAALLDALESEIIAGAGLDVFWNEPMIDPRFVVMNSVVLQPHHASGTVEARQAMGQLVRDNLEAHFAGRPLLTPID